MYLVAIIDWYSWLRQHYEYEQEFVEAHAIFATVIEAVSTSVSDIYLGYNGEHLRALQLVY